MSDTANSQRSKLGFDALIEDLFGLNIRGLATIRDIFWRPRTVFEAARSPDWQERYTPSIRLVFSILTVMAFFSFVWAAEDSPFMQGLIEGYRASGEETGQSIESAREDVNTIVGLYAGSLPFAYILCHSLMALLVRIWGKGTSAVVRLRLYMLSVVPSMLISVISLFFFTKLGSSALYLTFSYGSVLLADAVTSYRGGIAGASRLRRVLKALLFAFASFITTAVASALAIAIPAFWVGLQTYSATQAGL